MFKKSETEAERVRKVTTEFVATGLGASALDDIWVVLAGLPMPPALELNSTKYTGPIPHNAFIYDMTAHRAYIRDNTPRVEPVTESDWDEQAIKSNLGWTETQLRAARASGFPKATGHRTKFDGDGVPTERIMTWAPALVRNWFNQVNGLVVTGQ